MTEREEKDRDRGVNRRAALGAIGSAGLGAIGVVAATRAAASSSTATPQTSASTATPACVLAPELTEGPYYLDYELFRRDITEGKEGVPLILRATVVDSTTCKPIPHAALDIWHCDALGEYSGYTAMGVGGGNGGGGTPPTGAPPTGTPTDTPTGAPPTGAPPGGGHTEPTDALTFLRGVQIANHNGVVEFRTLYPGWYLGRAIHIHAKVHIGGKVVGKKYNGGQVAHTGQFFFDEKITEQIATLQPYKINTTTRTTPDEDSIFSDGGSAGLLTLRNLHRHQKSIAQGLLATIVVGVNPSATP